MAHPGNDSRQQFTARDLLRHSPNEVRAGTENAALDRLWQQRIETVQGVALAPAKLVGNAHLVAGLELVPLSQSQTVTVAVRCNDGRTGIATATRDTATSGGGKVTFSDGSEWTFVFGEAARNI